MMDEIRMIFTALAYLFAVASLIGLGAALRGLFRAWHDVQTTLRLDAHMRNLDQRRRIGL